MVRRIKQQQRECEEEKTKHGPKSVAEIGKQMSKQQSSSPQMLHGSDCSSFRSHNHFTPAAIQRGRLSSKRRSSSILQFRLIYNPSINQSDESSRVESVSQASGGGGGSFQYATGQLTILLALSLSLCVVPPFSWQIIRPSSHLVSGHRLHRRRQHHQCYCRSNEQRRAKCKARQHKSILIAHQPTLAVINLANSVLVVGKTYLLARENDGSRGGVKERFWHRLPFQTLTLKSKNQLDSKKLVLFSKLIIALIQQSQLERGSRFSLLELFVHWLILFWFLRNPNSATNKTDEISSSSPSYFFHFHCSLAPLQKAAEWRRKDFESSCKHLL